MTTYTHELTGERAPLITMDSIRHRVPGDAPNRVSTPLGEGYLEDVAGTLGVFRRQVRMDAGGNAWPLTRPPRGIATTVIGADLIAWVQL